MAAHSTDSSFRDAISTVNAAGKRAWIYPKIPKGKWYNRRKALSYLLLAFLFSAPFIHVNGQQFLMFNVLERRFSLFGFPFWPQDFHIFVLVMIIGVVGLALFTVAFGRIFCGWFCPQTIFMEMLFRRIEFGIDGDRTAQMQLDKMPWTAEKIRKRLLKWFLFAVISFWIANVFLAYLIGSNELYKLVETGPTNNLGTFISLLIFTAVFYFIYVWFREQVCLIVCPYGRMQGVLVDDKTVNVLYDHKRGEKEVGRFKFNKNEDRSSSGKGDCIDCKQCVFVCPTGIDIRNGVQLECTNCTACIDECDSIMQRVGLPKGLIRYASEKEIENQTPFVFTVRMKAYAAVLAVLLVVLGVALQQRNEVEATVLRLPGQLFQHQGTYIENVFTYKIVNKTTHDFRNTELRIAYPHAQINRVGGRSFIIGSEKLSKGTFFIRIPETELKGEKTQLRIEIWANGKKIEDATTEFLGPREYF